MRITKNKILLTGATSGIGLELVSELIKLHNTVIGVGRNAKQLKALQEKYQEFIPFEADLSNLKHIDKLADFIRTQHTDTNMLINNAGIMLYYEFTDTSSQFDDIAKEITINLTSPIQVTRLLLPVISKNSSAAIVNVTSALGIFAIKESSVYCATKAGLHLFTRSLRKQLSGVKVFEVLPTKTDTPMSEGKGSEKTSAQQVAKEIIAGIKADHEEINIGKLGLLRKMARLNYKFAEDLVQKKQR